MKCKFSKSSAVGKLPVVYMCEECGGTSTTGLEEECILSPYEEEESFIGDATEFHVAAHGLEKVIQLYVRQVRNLLETEDASPEGMDLAIELLKKAKELLA